MTDCYNPHCTAMGVQACQKLCGEKLSWVAPKSQSHTKAMLYTADSEFLLANLKIADKIAGQFECMGF